ncbi:MAG: hypothetical protein U9R74_07225 [Pseudomonadota bacterium]|nr:hypothetical protein [Pseudomonadota bacterium]
MRTSKTVIVLVFLLLALVSGSAHAYVGPGAGLTAIGTVIALIGAILLALIGFIWYPVKRLLSRKKTGQSATESPHGESPATPQKRETTTDDIES